MEHPTPSHHLLKTNVSPAPGFATDGQICGRTENIFTKNLFRIHELCDQKQGIKLTSLLNHNVPRADCRFIAKALTSSTNGDA